MNVAKLSAIANRLLDLAAEVECGLAYVGCDTLIKISQEISFAIQPATLTNKDDCWSHLKGMNGNLSSPNSPESSSCKSTKKVSFDLKLYISPQINDGVCYRSTQGDK